MREKETRPAVESKRVTVVNDRSMIAQSEREWKRGCWCFAALAATGMAFVTLCETGVL